MIKNPKKWINANYKKVDKVLIHYESCKDSMEEVIKLAKKRKLKVGIAINPKTKVSLIKDYL